MHRFKFILFFLSISIAANALASGGYADRADVKNFINEFSDRHQYHKPSLIKLFRQVEQQVQVLEAIQRPAEKKNNWQEYKNIFITPERVNEGLRFWAENAQVLAVAERRFGVPPEIIVAILGVETFYGKYEGKFPVLDSLVTLGFDYKPRQKFFRSELEHFLLLTQEEKLNPIEIKGSYAGAMGKSQFISSSYRQFAIDFDNNGKRDLWGSNEDIIGSVANYFKQHGWRMGEPITIPVTVHGGGYITLLKKGLKPVVSISELSQYDVEIDTKSYSQEKIALLELKNDNSAEYWVGFDNFYVITRYNHSHMYAMAVYQLSRYIKQDIKDYIVQN